MQKLHGARLLRFSHKDAYSPVTDAAGEHLYLLRRKQQHRPRQRRGVRRLAGKAYFTAGAAARYPGKVRAAAVAQRAHLRAGCVVKR